MIKLKTCPQCLGSFSETEEYCPKCAVELENPTPASFDHIGLDNFGPQLTSLQAIAPQFNPKPVVTPVLPRPIVPQQSPIQIIADMVAKIHAQTGTETIAVFCPYCKNYDDFTFIPVKKGVYEKICKHQGLRYNIEMGWFKEVSVKLIK